MHDSFNELKSMNVSMQLLGRVSIIFGTLLVSMLNLIVFADSSEMTELEKVKAYGHIYLYSLIVPIISVSGIFLAYLNQQNKYKKLVANGINPIKASRMILNVPEATKPNMPKLNAIRIPENKKPRRNEKLFFVTFA